MPIFNSLGSNYDFHYAYLALSQLWTKTDRRPELITKLQQQFDGQVQLFYKGRDAIEYILRAYGIGQGDQVITQAFACFAIEEGITRAGARPVYADITADSLNPDVKTLTAALKKAPRAKAVLIQHTLGIPAPIVLIKKWCKENNLLLFEDLAQSLGGLNEVGEPLGTQADAIILSFGRDKIIDAVSGGATILKTKAVYQNSVNSTIDHHLDRHIIVKDMCYPLITWLIRHTHSFGLGQIIFQLAKKIHWLTSPIASPTEQMTILPAEYAPLVLLQLQQLSTAIKNRRKTAHRYAQSLPLMNKELIDRAANLRVALLVEQPDQLAKYLTTQGIYLTDRWYRQPVDSGSLNCHSEYVPHSCPQAETASQHIINLPTHQGITELDLTKIIQAIQAF
jgi:dTDP-4-amino-4,6-dideoxygalactose transaminase